MGNLTHNLAVKIIAVILVITLGTAAVLSAAALYICKGSDNDYGYTDGFYKTDICRELVYGDYITVSDYLNIIINKRISDHIGAADGKFYAGYLDDVIEKTEENTFDRIENYESSEVNYLRRKLLDTNFKYQVLSSGGKLLFGNYEGEEYGFAASYSFRYSSYDSPVTINCYVLKDLVYTDSYSQVDSMYNEITEHRSQIITLLAVSCFLCLLLFLFLMCSAGHRAGREGIVLNLQDRIPFDLYIILTVPVLCLVIASVDSFDYYGEFSTIIYRILAISAILVVVGIILLTFMLTLATRIKAGKWWRNTIVYRCCHLIAKFCSNLPLVWKGAVCVAAIIFAEFIFVISFPPGSLFVYSLIWIGFHGLIFALAVVALANMKKLKTSGEKLAGGDADYKTDTSSLMGDFKKHGENLNSISDGISLAVDERMKSERMKTELITNVSHDIKTPLTSIINYVDLLKKENIEGGHSAEYLEVLERQSARLKKLIEDLVEASKASTGNISATLAPTHVSEILGQAVAEYSERFDAAGLSAMVNCEDDMYIWADGRLLWRVFDNLLGNIRKYAMPSTRVYIDACHAEGNMVKITLKNVSGQPLNINPDELLERFVRGDSSRSTEGSGLGLSIARSLTELQKGKLDIAIDGDLFKIELYFFAAQNQLSE